MSTIEPIKDTLSRTIDMTSFNERYNKIKRDVLEHPQIQAFIQANKEQLSTEMIDRGMPRLFEFINQSTTCCGASTRNECTNLLNGFVPKLNIYNGNIEIAYEKCELHLKEDEEREFKSRITSLHMTKDILNADLGDFTSYDEESRFDLSEIVAKFIDTYEQTQQLESKGIYIYGTFGVGKSYALGAIANELAKLKLKSLIIYVPEFVRELKSAMGTNELEKNIDVLKKSQVLMLDDMGAEPITAWYRDEVLGAILQYRMTEKLPTFITSNLTYEELEQHLSVTENGNEDILKAKRILERIRALTSPIHLQGKNLRR